MLIKTASDQSRRLAELEALLRQADAAQRKRIEDDVRRLRAGIKGEAESAYHIDFHFAESRNWAVVHDLRLVHGDWVAQIDHLLINRWMECYVLESKHFNAGVKITDDGEFLRWNAWLKSYEGMPSPLIQNERHIKLLEQVMRGIELPTRLGLRIAPTFQTLVLVSPSARIDRAKRFDSSRVIKADHLKQKIWKDIDSENALLGAIKFAAKIVSSETLEEVARQLAALHRPLETSLGARYGIREQPDTYKVVECPPMPRPAGESASAPPPGGGPVCKQCQKSRGQILYGKYGYYFKCGDCAANTAIRLACQPGHQPRLRKQGDRFFRDCEACASSELYFQND